MASPALLRGRCADLENLAIGKPNDLMLAGKASIGDWADRHSQLEIKVEERIIPKMNAAFKPIWLAALRGGKYIQGKGYLVVPVEHSRQVSADSQPGSMCCLGVLRAAVPALRSLGIEDFSFLTEAQAHLAGIAKVQNDLATMNDGEDNL